MSSDELAQMLCMRYLLRKRPAPECQSMRAIEPRGKPPKLSLSFRAAHFLKELLGNAAFSQIHVPRKVLPFVLPPFVLPTCRSLAPSLSLFPFFTTSPASRKVSYQAYSRMASSLCSNLEQIFFSSEQHFSRFPPSPCPTLFPHLHAWKMLSRSHALSIFLFPPSPCPRSSLTYTQVLWFSVQPNPLRSRAYLCSSLWFHCI